MKLKEKFNKAKEKAVKVKNFVSEHRGEIGLGMAVIGGGMIGAAINTLYDNHKYGGIRRVDGYTHINADGEEDGWMFTVSPTVRQMKAKDNTPNRIVEFETKEKYEEACKIMDSKLKK